MNTKRHLFKFVQCPNKIMLFRYALNSIIKSKANRHRLEC